MTSRKLKILIADDHAMVREGLATILSFEGDFSVVGEAEDGEDAVRKAAALKPDLVLMDLMMPGLDGADATARIRSEHPDTQVLILTSYGDSAHLGRAFANGAGGAITKTMPKESLVSAIRDVASGTRVIAPEIRRTLDEDSAMPELTPRQIDILGLLARGFTNKDMARLFGLSTAGIKFHLLTIFRKLGASNRAEAVNIALRKHLLKV